MTIQIDSREKPKAIKNIILCFEQKNIQYFVSKLYVGDYMSLDNPHVVVDRKQNLQEVYQNLIQDHTRFIKELKNAQRVSIRLVILIEHGDEIKTLDDVKTWDNPRINQYSTNLKKLLNIDLSQDIPVNELFKMAKAQDLDPKKPPVSSLTLHRMMSTLANKYGISWVFCSKEETANKIIDILKEV